MARDDSLIDRNNYTQFEPLSNDMRKVQWHCGRLIESPVGTGDTI